MTGGWTIGIPFTFLGSFFEKIAADSTLDTLTSIIADIGTHDASHKRDIGLAAFAWRRIGLHDAVATGFFFA